MATIIGNEIMRKPIETITGDFESVSATKDDVERSLEPENAFDSVPIPEVAALIEDRTSSVASTTIKNEDMRPDSTVTMIRIYSKTPVNERNITPADMKTFYDPKTGYLLDAVPIKRPSTSVVEPLSTKNNTVTVNRGGFITNGNRFGPPVNKTSRGTVVRVAPAPSFHSSSLEFETIPEASIEDDSKVIEEELFVSPNSLRETLVDRNTGEIIEALPIMDHHIQYHNYSVVARSEHHFADDDTTNMASSSNFKINERGDDYNGLNRTVNVNANNSNVINKNTKKMNTNAIKIMRNSKPAKKEPPSMKRQSRPKFLRNSVKPAIPKRSTMRTVSRQPVKRRNTVPKTNKTISTAQKKSFYLTKSRLLGYVTENIQDTRFSNSNNNSNRKAIQTTKKKQIKSDFYNTDFNKIDFNKFTSSYHDDEKYEVLKALNNEKSTKQFTGNRQHEIVTSDDFEPESPMSSRQNTPPPSPPIVATSTVRSDIQRNSQYKKPIPNYLVRSTFTSRSRTREQVVSRASKYNAPKRFLEIESLQTINETPPPPPPPAVTIGTVMRNDDGTIFITPLPKRKMHYNEMIKDKNYEFDLIDERRENKVSKIKESEEKKEQPVVWCCECEGNKKSTSNMFCAFQCWLIAVVLAVIVLIIVALVATLVYYKP